MTAIFFNGTIFVTMGVFSKIRKELKRKITIMLIPHGKIKPLKMSISLLFLGICMVSWTSLTLWAGYLASRHIDYIKTKADNQIMKIRLVFFANQLEKTKNVIEKVRNNDDRIRSLLSLNSKQSIIEEDILQNPGEGGPTLAQANALSVILSGNMDKIDYKFLARQTYRINKEYDYIRTSYGEIMSHIKQQRSLFMAIPRGWPCEGRIASPYGFRYNPFFKSKDFHSGLDIANVKNTPIHATANGRVIFAGWQSGYGYIAVIDHGYNYRTAYAHNAKLLVKSGQYVHRGDIIAKMGSTGSATGSHVHYEVHYKGKTVSPVAYLSDYFYTQSERKRYDEKKLKRFA